MRTLDIDFIRSQFPAFPNRHWQVRHSLKMQVAPIHASTLLTDCIVSIVNERYSLMRPMMRHVLAGKKWTKRVHGLRL